MSESQSETLSETITETRNSEQDSTTPAQSSPRQLRFRIQDYALILKPRVMSLVVFTAGVGLFLAPGTIDFDKAIVAILCIAIGAGASGAINMWYDQDIDLIMKRTIKRPIPAGNMHPLEALAFGTVLSIAAVSVMAWRVNIPSALLLAGTILFYVFIYTMWLKRITPQNIVIGGAAGAFPPMIGWTAVSGDIALDSIALFGIIFLWTPPHSWALALFRKGDYEEAGVPMLPVVAGERETKRQILIYTALLIPFSFSPVFLGYAGIIYALFCAGFGVFFIKHTWLLWKAEENTGEARRLFLFSILYLFMLFVGLAVDKLLYMPINALI